MDNKFNQETKVTTTLDPQLLKSVKYRPTVQRRHQEPTSRRHRRQARGEFTMSEQFVISYVIERGRVHLKEIALVLCGGDALKAKNLARRPRWANAIIMKGAGWYEAPGYRKALKAAKAKPAQPAAQA